MTQRSSTQGAAFVATFIAAAVITTPERARAASCSGLTSTCGGTAACFSDTLSSGSATSSALYGEVDQGTAVKGLATGTVPKQHTEVGVMGLAGTSTCATPTGIYGGYFFSAGSGIGVGVYGENDSVGSEGVQGVSSAGYGVYGSTLTGYGVYGVGNGNGGVGVYGTSGTNIGVYGSTFANTPGVAAGYFTTQAGSSSTALAAANDSTGTGLYARSRGGDAGYFEGNVVITGSCSGCGSGSSDSRLKKNVKPIAGEAAIDDLLKLKGVTFEWIDPARQGNQQGTQRGLIAQDVEKVFPNWVREGNDGFKVVDYRQTEALEIESIRELKAENDAMKARLQALEDARRPRLSSNAAGLGLGLGGLALACAAVVGRRKRDVEGP